MVFPLYQTLVFEWRDQLRARPITQPDASSKNVGHTALVDSLVRFVKSGQFMNAENDKSPPKRPASRSKTTPEMAKYPRILLSLP